jgi:hypothetical protein
MAALDLVALQLKRDTITTTPPFAPSVPTTITYNTTTQNLNRIN